MINVEIICDCNLFNFGLIRDYCHDLTLELTGGNIYGIISEPGAGGGALSYALAGKVERLNGIILVNGKEVDAGMLRNVSCYVGEGGQHEQTKENTIKNQLIDGLKQGHINSSLSHIVEVFGLSESRLDRTIDYVSNERWNASMAIGYVFGKKNFLFSLAKWHLVQIDLRTR